MQLSAHDIIPVELKSVQQATTAFLLHYCEQQHERAHRIAPAYGRLWHALSNQVQHGGKRLRPYMCTLTYQAYGGRDMTGIVAIGAAWELLHLGLLIHDDIIDRDDIRHGRPNVSGEYWQHYDGLSDPLTRRHAADSAALLGGDLLLSSAYQLILESSFEADAKLMLCRQLGAALYDVGGGELLDSEAAFQPAVAVNPELIAEYKTASYSFIGPLLAGAKLAGATAADVDRLRSLGHALGVGYQTADDLLGVFGDTTNTGKSTDSDLQEAKRTAVLVEGLELLGDGKRTQAEALLSKPLPLALDDVEQLRQLLHESGVEQRIEDRLSDFQNAAHSTIEALQTADSFKRALDSLADAALQRKA